MNRREQLCEVSRALPPAAQAELLDFAEFLRQKHRVSAALPPIPLQSLAGGLEDSANFAASPMDIQQRLRRDWD